MKRSLTALALAAGLLASPLATAAAQADQVAGPGTTLGPGAGLSIGGWVAVMQGDGNFVIYANGVAQFSTRTGVPGSRAVMQGDGNFVVYTPSNSAVFNTGTSSPNSQLVLQADGNLVIYSPTRATWARTTGRIAGIAVPGDGTFFSPSQVPFGTYVSGGNDGCYWQTSTPSGAFLDNDFTSGQSILVVTPQTGFVETSGCNTFFQV